ncbi:MAG: dienelactone hydrolase [Kordiimonadales bacterium]|nr:MAG: dienelactone hydrolase [Kordiimonadales bacterium]
MTEIQALEGFTKTSFCDEGIEKPVYRLGDLGCPPVLIMQELPGMTVHTLALAEKLVSDGFVVYLPHLFGDIAAPIAVAKNALRLCLQKEFNFLAWRKPSPITNWLRALCRFISTENGERPIGAIGMCLTGRFVLSLMVEKSMTAPVMSQPGHPGGHGNAKKAATLGIPESELAEAKARVRDDGLCILGLRFQNDPFCPPDRFTTMEREFGENFIRFDIDASLYAEHNIRKDAHAVLTIDASEDPDHPTQQAYAKMLGFFKKRIA